jgi:hypothetical protein
LADDFNHLESHFDAILSIILGIRDRPESVLNSSVLNSRHAVITVTEDFDS